MGKSLQDQLLKAGLANKKQAVKAKKAKNSKEKLKRSGKEVEDEITAAAARASAEKLAKDRELNSRKNQQAEQVAIQAQIAQLIDMNAITERGEIDYSFPDGKLIKTLSVNERQQQALVNGALAIVKLNDSYSLVPRMTAEKISERNDSVVILCNVESAEQQQDDEYAEFKVPDDLMW